MHAVLPVPVSMVASTASAMIVTASAMIVTASAVIVTASAAVFPPRISVPRSEMTDLVPAIIPVIPVIIVPVMMNPVKRVSPDTVWDIAVADRQPGTVIIGGGIPDVSTMEIVTAAEIEEVVRHSDSYIKPERRRGYEFRRRGDYHGRRRSDINTYTYSDIRRVALCNRRGQDHGETE
jgi:hypothetical protein